MTREQVNGLMQDSSDAAVMELVLTSSKERKEDVIKKTLRSEDYSTQ